MIVGTQGYVWHQVYEAQGLRVDDHWDDVLRQVAAAGCAAFEHNADSMQTPEKLRLMDGLLRKYGLSMPSVYVNTRLHDENWRRSVEQAAAAAARLAPLGVRVVVTNPEPTDWKEPRDKTDDELIRQAAALEVLGREVGRLGMRLAYHMHAPELRAAARELHHMMLATDPQQVGLCLDAHWIYRGAGNSQVALYDIVRLYGQRIVSVHLRQSRGGIWTQTLCDGDIDYRPLAQTLHRMHFDGPLIMEQAIEPGTSTDLAVMERERASRQWVRQTFGV